MATYIRNSTGPISKVQNVPTWSVNKDNARFYTTTAWSDSPEEDQRFCSRRCFLDRISRNCSTHHDGFGRQQHKCSPPPRTQRSRLARFACRPLGQWHPVEGRTGGHSACWNNTLHSACWNNTLQLRNVWFDRAEANCSPITNRRQVSTSANLLKKHVTVEIIRTEFENAMAYSWFASNLHQA